MKEILRLLLLHTGVTLTDFVDDLLGGAEDEQRAGEQMQTVVDFFLRVGLPVSSKPTGLRPPSQVQTWVGWEFDTVRNAVRVTPEKCARCRTSWSDVLEADNQRTLLARQLASAASLASHIAEIFLQGRRRLHHVWADLNRAQVCQL